MYEIKPVECTLTYNGHGEARESYRVFFHVYRDGLLETTFYDQTAAQKYVAQQRQ